MLPIVKPPTKEYSGERYLNVAEPCKALPENEVKDHYYSFVNKGLIDSPGAVKQYEGS